MAPEMTILLLGANGQVGHELQRSLAPLGAVTALDFPEVNFAEPELLREIVRKLRPAIIVNAAAHTAVDKAESEPALAEALNARAPGVLAYEAQLLGAILLHYSTDYVFDGTKDGFWTETDAPNPLSVYGRSKLAGEEAVRACARHVTFRTSWVIGAHGNNFIKTMLRLACERDSLRVVADQYGAPTSAALLADVTAAILTQMKTAPAGDSRWGLYHLVASGETSWHGLAQHLIGYAAAHGAGLKARPETVSPIGTADYPTPATRPANSRLDTSKIRGTFGVNLPNWTVGVNDVLDRILLVSQP
jgi:dTDP-4-dehydrorhamnose reductase